MDMCPKFIMCEMYFSPDTGIRSNWQKENSERASDQFGTQLLIYERSLSI